VVIGSDAVYDEVQYGNWVIHIR